MLRQRSEAAGAARNKHRPPIDMLSLLEASATDWQERYSALVSSKEFLLLRTLGVIKRSPWGRLPEHKLQEYWDQKLVEFARTYDMDSRFPGWIEEMSDHRIATKTLIAKFGTPARETTALARFLRQDLTDSRHLQATSSALVEPSATSDLDEAVTFEIANLIQRHAISQSDFASLLDLDEPELAPAALALGFSKAESDQISSLLTSIRIADMANSGAVSDDLSAIAEIVGTVGIHPYSGAVLLEMEPWAAEPGCYYVDEKCLSQVEDALLATDTQRVLVEVRNLGKCGNLLRTVIEVIVRSQEDFFISGTASSLAPLPQAWVARKCDVPRSAVCRIIRNRCIESPWGQLHLQDLCPSVGNVVRAIAEANPDWSAPEIAEYLQAVHGVVISSRTVAHHRSKKA